MKSSQFVNNTAGLYGGAIAQTGGATDGVTIAGSTFSGNAAGCQGGTLFLYDLDSLVVTGSTFDSSSTALDPTTTTGERTLRKLRLSTRRSLLQAQDAFSRQHSDACPAALPMVPPQLQVPWQGSMLAGRWHVRWELYVAEVMRLRLFSPAPLK